MNHPFYSINIHFCDIPSGLSMDGGQYVQLPRKTFYRASVMRLSDMHMLTIESATITEWPDGETPVEITDHNKALSEVLDLIKDAINR